jgi:hypothetical protein
MVIGTIVNITLVCWIVPEVGMHHGTCCEPYIKPSPIVPSYVVAVICIDIMQLPPPKQIRTGSISTLGKLELSILVNQMISPTPSWHLEIHGLCPGLIQLPSPYVLYCFIISSIGHSCHGYWDSCSLYIYIYQTISYSVDICRHKICTVQPVLGGQCCCPRILQVSPRRLRCHDKNGVADAHYLSAS